MRREPNPVLRLFIWIVLVGAVLFVGFRVLFYENLSVSESARLARLLNEAVLLNTMQPTGDESTSGLCQRGELEAGDWSALHGTCNLFFPASQGKYCEFYWIGRSCLVIGVAEYAFQDETVRERIDLFFKARCENGRDWFCGYSLKFAVYPNDYGLKFPRPPATRVVRYNSSDGLSES